jgi:hypothetical protein
MLNGTRQLKVFDLEMNFLQNVCVTDNIHSMFADPELNRLIVGKGSATHLEFKFYQLDNTGSIQSELLTVSREHVNEPIWFRQGNLLVTTYHYYYRFNVRNLLRKRD